MAEITSTTHRLKSGAEAVVRSATPDDAPHTLALYASVIDEGRFTLLEPDELQRTVERERASIRDDRVNPGALSLVATVDGIVVGTARLQAGSLRRTAHTATVDSVWVHTNWRGQGVGNAMMRILIAWARAHQEIEKLGLYVFSTSTGAIALYERLGFVVEGRGVRDMKLGDGTYIDTVIMGLFVKKDFA